MPAEEHVIQVRFSAMLRGIPLLPLPANQPTDCNAANPNDGGQRRRINVGAVDLEGSRWGGRGKDGSESSGYPLELPRWSCNLRHRTYNFREFVLKNEIPGKTGFSAVPKWPCALFRCHSGDMLAMLLIAVKNWWWALRASVRLSENYRTKNWG
jgi:hypothetical protein